MVAFARQVPVDDRFGQPELAADVAVAVVILK